MMVELTIGESMKRARKKRGITGRKLADLTGYCPTQISQWENDKQRPSLVAVIDVADALGVSIDELIGHEVRNVRNS